ncbi:MAG: M6 family metalloprotease domain-containing protein [Phycisphaerales bacterium]|nr:MAG: M6 family metalloprotease domain-containing protein [Phycisphaerales bacterium]
MIASAQAYGVPVFGEEFDLGQPDGSKVPVRIWGDEFYQVVESLDGFTLVRDQDTGFICYATCSPDGNELVSTGARPELFSGEDLGLVRHLRINPASARAKVQAARSRFSLENERVLAAIDARSAAGSLQIEPPSTGNVKALCLIVDFDDEPGTIDPSEVDDFCNRLGYGSYGNNGSVRDYFSDVSDGGLDYTNYVPTAYYRALEDKGYYDNPLEEIGPKARELILEALNDLEASGHDFSQYDSNGDNVIDGINCFYAGEVESGWGMGLWPHSWTVEFYADGVEALMYQITDMGAALSIGTFCHENGHMLCWFHDLYDYDYDSSGVGYYCLMAAGSHVDSGRNPVEPCAYLKYWADWATPTVLAAPATGLPLTAGVNTSYIFLHPTLFNEFYLVENRQQTGRDAGLPDAGIALWHVDVFGSNNFQDMTPGSHYECTLVQADGQWDLESNLNEGDGTDLFDSDSYAECTPYTTPNTNWWSGAPSFLMVTEVSASAATMTFTYRTADCNGNNILDGVEIAQGSSDDCNNNDVPDICDVTQGTSDDTNSNLIPDECEADCNGNEIPDTTDIAAGTSVDCNTNDVPDDCDMDFGTSQDCQPNAVPDDCEADSDGDQEIDDCDGCPLDPAKDDPGLCGCGQVDDPTDYDGDSTPDCVDDCPQDPFKIAPGWCGCHRIEDSANSDSDPVPDCADMCAFDGGKTMPGVCGCGMPDNDTDGDGVFDCHEDCPFDPYKRDPGLCGCGVNDFDSDGDNVPDRCTDECPDDPAKSLPGACGCGVPDTDGDGDGQADCKDNCPDKWNPDQADSDGDGVGDACAPVSPEPQVETEQPPTLDQPQPEMQLPCSLTAAAPAALLTLWALGASKLARKKKLRFPRANS